MTASAGHAEPHCSRSRARHRETGMDFTWASRLVTNCCNVTGNSCFWPSLSTVNFTTSPTRQSSRRASSSVITTQRTIQGRDDSGGERPVESKWITDCKHFLSHFQIAAGRHRARGGVGLAAEPCLDCLLVRLVLVLPVWETCFILPHSGPAKVLCRRGYPAPSAANRPGPAPAWRRQVQRRCRARCRDRE